MCDEQKTKPQLIQELAVLRRQVTRLETIGDAMNQSLYGLSLYADAATERLAAGDATLATDYLQELQEATQALLRTVRLLAHHWCPTSLKDGLVAALRERLACVEQTLGVDADVAVLGDWPCLPDVDEPLYLIVQDVLDQILKDGRAHRIQLRLRRGAQRSSVEFCVDGASFYTEGIAGSALQHELREHPSRFGDKLHVSIHPDGAGRAATHPGATIRIEFPHDRSGENLGRI